LTISLAQVGQLKVIATSSAARYQGTGKGPTDIARELGVDALVEGAVERSGDRVRITAQLIDGTSARVLWAKPYDRDLRDALALQSEVTRTIADEIRVQLTPEERERTHGAAGRVQGEPGILADLGASYAAAGRRADAVRVLGAIEAMRKPGSERRARAWHLAVVHAALGEKDRAFRDLDEGYGERPSEMMFLKVDPRIDSLRSDSRYAELLRRMGLSE
jgi:hypothetical protein